MHHIERLEFTGLRLLVVVNLNLEPSLDSIPPQCCESVIKFSGLCSQNRK